MPNEISSTVEATSWAVGARRMISILMQPDIRPDDLHIPHPILISLRKLGSRLPIDEGIEVVYRHSRYSWLGLLRLKLRSLVDGIALEIRRRSHHERATQRIARQLSLAVMCLAWAEAVDTELLPRVEAIVGADVKPGEEE